MTTKSKPKVQSSLTWKKTRFQPREELQVLAQGLGEDEIRILVRVARRLEFGRQRYGLMDLKNDKRDFVKEATEEILDWLVYVESDIERKAQKRKRGTR